MLRARNIRYELADRTRGLGAGGIGAMHLLARRTGLIEAIDQRLKLLKVHLPYHESDHVLNIAHNILCGGTCLEDISYKGEWGYPRTSRRRIIYRLLAWNPWQHVFLRAVDALRWPMRC